ncbi:receptor accessory protein 4 [Geranomyces variabilis]|nr:receptor accessory protein 4 [Geranomyces variabilis]
MAITYYLARSVGNFAGYWYPAYLSYKAVRERNSDTIDRWLIHWIVMSFFAACEIPGDILLFWMPLYYETKLLIILWLVLPYTQGSHFVYRHLVRPALDEHERDIDAAMSQAQVAATQWAVEKGRGIMTGARNAIAQAVFNGQFSLFANQALTNPHNPVPPATSPGTTRRRRPRPRIVEVDDDGDSIDDSDASYAPPPKARAATRRRTSTVVVARTSTRRTRQSRGSVVVAGASGGSNSKGSGSSTRASRASSRASRGSEDVVSDDDG